MDLKPKHLILSYRGLFIVDYGCSYFVANGRPTYLMLSSPVFSSVRDDSHFANPVQYNRQYCSTSIDIIIRVLQQIGNHLRSVSVFWLNKNYHGLGDRRGYQSTNMLE